MASRTKAWEPKQKAAYTSRVCKLARQAVGQAKGSSKAFAVAATVGYVQGSNSASAVAVVAVEVAAAVALPEHKGLQHVKGDAAVAYILKSRAAMVRPAPAAEWHTPVPSCPRARPMKVVPPGA